MWYNQIRWYSESEIATMRSSPVEIRINMILNKANVVLDKSFVSLYEVRRLEELLDTLNNSELDGVEHLRRKVVQVKRAINDSLALAQQLDGLVMRLYEELNERS